MAALSKSAKPPAEASDSNFEKPGTRVNALKIRGIQGRRCFSCCQKAMNDVSSFVNSLAVIAQTIELGQTAAVSAPNLDGELNYVANSATLFGVTVTLRAPILEALSPGPSRGIIMRQIALQEGEATFTKFVKNPSPSIEGKAAAVGQLELAPILSPAAVLQAVADVIRAVSVFDCLDCVERKTWTQSNPVVTVTKTKDRTRRPPAV